MSAIDIPTLRRRQLFLALALGTVLLAGACAPLDHLDLAGERATQRYNHQHDSAGHPG